MQFYVTILVICGSTVPNGTSYLPLTIPVYREAFPYTFHYIERLLVYSHRHTAFYTLTDFSSDNSLFERPCRDRTTTNKVTTACTNGRLKIERNICQCEKALRIHLKASTNRFSDLLFMADHTINTY